MKDKESWEQTRMQAYITAQVNSTKKLSINDVLTFPWEVDNTEKEEDTPEEREAIMKEMKEWEKKMNKK